jgi:fibronectin-binding autotransporter adhesin
MQAQNYPIRRSIRIIFVVLALYFFSVQQLFAVNYYSYQSGAWNNLTTWTTDPSGTALVGSAVPANTDNVTVLDGITVTLTANVSTTGNTLTLRPTGTLNMSTFQFTTTLSALAGSGLIRIGSATFPTATSNTFVAAGGGTIEYFNFGGAGTNLPAQSTYNNLILTNSTITNQTLRFANGTNPSNYTINGNLSLSRSSTGTLALVFGNVATNVINANVAGNTSIGNGCSVSVGNFNAIHNLSFAGDFTNNGTVRFTNQASPVTTAYYTAATTTTGAARVSFIGTSNSVLSCNGITDFYTFILNKGIDQTYILTVNSSNVANFALYGPNNGASATKALYLIAGTLKLNSNINIPSLTEGGIDFGIPETGTLWINGATVSTTIVGLNGTGYQALSVFGKIQVSAGSMSSGDAAGLVCWSSNSPEIIVEGTGVLDVSQIWTTATIGIETYIQTGGTTNIRANGEVHGGPMFQFNSNSAVINISGGTLNFLNGIFTAGQGIDIQCAPGNFSITGGTINVNEPGGTNFGINSTVPFYDLNISRQSGAGNSTVTLLNTSATTITVQNNLLLNANTVLDAAANTVSLSIGGNFAISATSTYTPGNTSTTLNGSGAQLFTLDGTISSGLFNFVVNKTAGTATLAGSAVSLAVRNNLSILAGSFADGGKTVDVKGNVLNSGTHSGSGKISMTGTNTQTVGGNGAGVFQNLELNNTNAAAAPISFTANQFVGGTLTLTSNKITDIGLYNLSLGASATIAGTPGAARFIRTSGLRSDGGLSKLYSTNSFTFPVGTASDYTPSTISFSVAPSVYGTITVRPVASEHPNVTITGRSLSYYWRTSSAGFILGAATVTQTYTYPQADVVAGGNVSEAEYVPARFNTNSLSWASSTLVDVNTTTNVITFQGLTFNSLIDGDFTAGDNNPTNPFGAVLVYYSRVNTGNWETASSWSVDQVLKWAGAASASTPSASSPVVIGNGSSFNHIITVTANAKVCGSLEIGTGSVLNLGTTTGHNFTTYVSGNATGKGSLRISSAAATAQFPAGDFGLFINNTGGTVEYYSTGAQDFSIPLLSAAPSSGALNNYFNLVLSPGTGRTITLPNSDLTVYNNLTVTGASATARALLNATTTRTLSIGGNLVVSAGNLQYQNGTLQNVTVGGNVDVAAASIFDVANAGTAVVNTLSINGNLINNGVFDMRISATRICDVSFTGSSNSQVTGTTGTLTEFNLVTIDKGTSQSSELDVNVGGALSTLSNNWLNLVNGTFKFSKAATLTLTNVAGSNFFIPPTAAINLNNSNAILNIGSVASDNADLLLAGKLLITNGTVNIGNTANANNNDIEYSGAGFPEIELLGGTLNVNGQIRKSAISTAGSLVYKQSGSSVVVIFGQNQLATKSKLQINGTGSVFNMSGSSTLTLVRGGGTTYQDLYLQAASSTVSGGTIIIGNATTPAASTFNLNCINPVHTLTVDANTTTKTAQLQVNAIQINNDLLINGNSVFNANGLNVNIGRNLSNANTSATAGLTVGGYRAASSNQVTTFSSSLGNQTISGVAGNLTNFANLVVANTFLGGSVSASANTAIQVNTNLTLSSNTFSDGGNILSVLGNISNSATHTSTGSGRISLAGSSSQVLSGNGSGIYGNLTLNNIAGAILSANSSITGILNFNVNCIFNINDRLLTLGVASTVVGNNASRYIETNGVSSDLGVKKDFPIGASNYTFAIGVAAKYTPVQFTIAATTAVGSITVKSVNIAHPATTDALAKELRYYWNVTSTGFAALSVTHVYNYIQGDVFGTEATYVGARNLAGLWTPVSGIPLSVNAAANTITLTGVNYLNGDFTAGEASEFAAPLTFYSRNLRTSNNWNNTNADTWSTDPVLKHAGAAVATSPSTFNTVVIASGHTIDANGDFRKCAALSLLGTLNLSSNVGHDLGTVTGTGTLRIASTPGNFYAFPSGNYTAFVAAGGGTFEFNTASTANMPTQSTYNNLRFTGSGTSTLPNTDLILNGSLSSTAGTIDNALNSRNIDIKGNWTNTGNSFIPGTGSVTLSGTSAQTISRTGGETFYDLNLNGSGTKSLLSAITVNDDITITSNLDVDVLGNYSINVKRNWVNNGVFLAQQGLVSFTGSGPQNISGANGFYNLTIDNSGGGVTITNGAQTLTAGLNLVNGVFTTTGQSFTLLSTAAATAYILPVGAGSVVGNVTMQRYIPAGIPGWFLLGSPVQGSVIEDWDDNLVTSGFTGSDGFAGGFISIFSYDETVGGVVDAAAAYVPVNNSTNATPIGKGFWVWMADNLSTLSANTVDVVGPPKIGSSNLNVTYTSSGGLANDGWNLVANPYCSTIDWGSLTGWTKTNMDDATYIYHGTTQQYASYVAGVGTNGGSRYLPSSQGFYVKANASAPVLIANENSKVTNNPVYLKQSSTSPLSQNSPVLYVSCEGNTFMDETAIHLVDSATSGFDSQLDALKLFSDNPQNISLSTRFGTQDYSVNSISGTATNLDIPLRAKVGISGTYTLNFTGISQFSGFTCLSLEDTYTGITADLRTQNTFSFYLSDTSNLPRFTIHISTAVKVETVASICGNNGSGKVILTGTSGSQFSLINNQGVIIQSVAASLGTDTIWSLNAGDYVLLYTDSNSACINLTDTITIEDSQNVFASFSSSSQVVLPNQLIQFTNQSQGASSYLWDFGDSTALDTSANPFHSYAGPGTYTITLLASNNLGCSKISSIVITVQNNTSVASLGAAEQITIGSDEYGLILNYSLLKQTSVRLNLYDLLGKKVQQEQIVSLQNKGIHNVALEAKLAKGIYTVELIYNNQRTSSKIVR